MNRRWVKSAVLCAVGTMLSGSAFAQAINPTMFVTNNVSDEISVFTIEKDGSLTWQANYPTGDGPISAALSPNGRYLAVGHATSSSTTEEMRFFEVNSDGSLTALFTSLVPDSPLDVVWIDDDTIAVTDTEIGGTNRVITYDVSIDFNGISMVDEGYTGDFSTELELNPSRTRLYANDSFGDRIYAFSVEPSGELTELIVMSTAPNFAVSLTISHDDSLLYGGGGISGDGNRVLGYEVQGDGNLVPLPGSPYFSPGESPKNAVFTEDDSMLFVGHGTDATVRAFFVEADGSLTYTGYMFDVGLQGTLDSIAVMDDLFFVTDESTSLDGLYGVYSFRIDQKSGTLKQIGLFETFGVRPEKIIPWPGTTKSGSLALIEDAVVTFGTLISGTIDDLLESDDEYLRARSRFGFTAIEPNLIRFRIDARTGAKETSFADLRFELRTNTPNGIATVYLRNQFTDALEQVGQHPLPVTEQTLELSNIPMNERINLGGGIEMQIKHVVPSVFTALGFTSSYDLIELFLHD